MPSQPSLPSLSNDINDLEKAACRPRAVPAGEAAVPAREAIAIGDGSDGSGDGNKNAAVPANPLKNENSDGRDGRDGIFAGGRFRALQDCPTGTICLRCRQPDAVKKIRDTSKPGSKTETLHEACAPAWFDGSGHREETPVCVHCGRPGGNQVSFGAELIRLHRECEEPYQRRQPDSEAG